MNTRKIIVTESRKNIKKASKGKTSKADGKPRVASHSEVDQSSTTKLTNTRKIKSQRSGSVSENIVMKACTGNQNKHTDFEITGFNKGQQKQGSAIQQSDKLSELRKGVKHKNFDSSENGQFKVKMRKTESSSTKQKTISTEQKPVSTKQKKKSAEQKPVSTKQKSITAEQKLILSKQKLASIKQSASATVTAPDSKQKSRPRSILPTSPDVAAQSVSSKQSKISRIRPDKIMQIKSDMKYQMKTSKSVPFHKSKQPQAASLRQGTVDSAKKRSNSNKEESAFDKHHQVKESKIEAAPLVDTSDPMALLMMMEGRTGNFSLPDRPCIPSASTSHTADPWSVEEEDIDDKATTSEGETEEMSDWEEVHDHHVADRSQIPDGPVEITLDMPNIFRHKKRENKTFDWKAHLKRRVQRFRKEVAANRHKVHLLCLLSLGLRQNEALNDVTVRAVLLSLLPPEHVARTKMNVQRQVENLLLWYKRKFSLENVSHCSNTRLVTATSLIDTVSQGVVTDARVWILVFIAILRTIGLTVRLVLSFQPVRFKAHQGWDEKKGRKKHQHQSSADPVKGGAPKPSPHTKCEKMASSSKVKGSHPVPKKKLAPKRRLSRRESSKAATLKNKIALKEADDDNDDVEETIDDGSDSDFSENCIQKLKDKTKKLATPAACSDNDSSSSELEFEESRPSFRSPVHVLKDLKILSNRKVLSPSTSDDEAAGGKRHGPLGQDIWLEVYMPDSKKWICFDCFKSVFGKPYNLENLATQPLMYVLGFKNDNSVKDVTARYAKQWLSHTRKNRIDQQWWAETLLMFDLTPFKDNLIEDDEIKGQLLVRPMPTSIGEFKSHPLYALKRHLLKFESIYPDTAVPLGYIKKEPVYARECVKTLHSRDNWLKEGRLVRLNEQPYKMVKSRPKWNKPKENPDALDLELFGEWQTEQYIPPPAVNGKVPRNEYGNVELFKPWMLPKGTVQVRGNGMQRVAKKLNIDVAPAMVGWDTHSGCSHPVMDGWVVCEEYADTLMVAWLEDQEVQRQRETEKREKRVYDNWRLLIRGLLIKERLKNKFLQDAPASNRLEKQETFSDEEVETAVDVQLSWPRNRQTQEIEEKSKMAELKSERERKLVEKCQVREVTNFKDGGQMKSDNEKKKKQGKMKNTSMVDNKRKLQEIVHSESGSSENEMGDKTLLKLKQGKMKKRRSVEDEDPDFVVSDGHRRASHKESKVDKNKKENADEQMKDRPGTRRTSLSRQAKNKVKVVDDASDSEICEDEGEKEGFTKMGVEDRGDGAASDVVEEESQKNGGKVRSVAAQKTRKKVNVSRRKQK